VSGAWKKLTELFQFINDAFMLTVAFILGTALGIIILGAAPALNSLLKTARRRPQDVGSRGVWVKFWGTYFSEFWSSNRLLLAPLVILFTLLLYFEYVPLIVGGVWQTISQYTFGVVAVVVGLAIVHLSRDAVQMDELPYLAALSAVFREPVRNFAYVTLVFGLIRVTFSIYGFGLLLGWGLWALLVAQFDEYLDSRKKTQ